jgi:hypothetical protein
MSVISNLNAQQAAYLAAIAAANELPHHPPPHRQMVTVTRNDLNGNPTQVTVGAVTYSAVSMKAGIEVMSASGEVTAIAEIDVDAVEAFTTALAALSA